MSNYYTSKSFILLGDSLSNCYGCSYCRVTDKTLSYHDIPQKNNNLPVAINLFYGDPSLQQENTIKILKELEEKEYKGIVTIVTKGNLSWFPKTKFNLDLHFGLSCFGKDSPYNGTPLSIFEKNLDVCSELGYNYSIEYRPLIYNINDDKDSIKRVCDKANEYNIPIAYSGLFVTPEMNLPKEFKPYPNSVFGVKKEVSKEVSNLFYEYANVPIFKKTSCLLSYSHNLKGDYNVHYYRPHEVNCQSCPMYEKCMSQKKITPILDDLIPWEYSLENMKFSCAMASVCSHPSSDCFNLSGWILKINDVITAGDMRVMRWKYGCMVQPKKIIWDDRVTIDLS